MRFRALAFAGVLSAAVIGAVVVGLWSLGSEAAERERFSTLAYAPKDAQLYIAINTEPASEQWIAFSDILDRLSIQDPARDAWDEALEEEDLDWDEDIVSLLGDEAYVAITDFSTLDDAAGAVAVFQLRNSGRAEDLFVERMGEALEDEGDELTETEYDGQTIYLFPNDFEEAFEDDDYDGFDDEDFEGDFGDDDEDVNFSAIAFTDTLAIVGLAEEDVRGVLDVAAGRAPTIMENPRFTDLQAQQVEDFLLWGWVDLAPAWDALEEYLRDEDEETYEELSTFFEEARGLLDRGTFSLTARGDGFIFDAQVMHRTDGGTLARWLPSKVFDSAYARRVPEDTLVFAAGYDAYNQGWLPAWDTLKDIDLSITDPYCTNTFGSYVLPYSPTFDEDEYYGGGGPFLEPFTDEDGDIDYDAYYAWYEELDRMFTRPDGSYDYEAYEAYLQGIVDAYCEERSQTFAEAVEEFEDEVGFDLEDDLLSLLTGEYAVAMDVSNFDADTPDFEILGVAEVTDPARATASIEKLIAWGEREGEIRDGGQSRGLNLVEWDDGDYGDEIEAAWGFDGKTFVAGYPEEAVRAFIDGDGGDSLAESGDWERTMRLLPVEKTSVLYVNVARILEEVQETEDAADEFEDAFNGEIELEDLEPIRSVGMATTNVDGGFALRLVVFVK